MRAFAREEEKMGYRKAKAKAKSMPKASRGVIRQVARRRQDADEVAIALFEAEELQREQEEEDKILLEEARLYWGGDDDYDDDENEEPSSFEEGSSAQFMSEEEWY
ncbi:MAG: hypothetical protein CO137_02990 [Candidatus Magasanikbacteria bacterium CG_4_9_14_3_um_filter_32_9]|uniref:Uncharacterized protein n=1 Tax=Candidatus Magasanikbacteria bacterium CG_4_9_14_3_um_filter_32_9 TaxID=1974644 RepID=A0A2M7Z6A8_9BACT|nr:MAG: hypothetical protein CO137_02990 [Candidatus Magasanikbacteria bacterium CG_4_9_14_3_um_filter_32_9]